MKQVGVLTWNTENQNVAKQMLTRLYQVKSV